jgi:hypothetical protein
LKGGTADSACRKDNANFEFGAFSADGQIPLWSRWCFVTGAGGLCFPCGLHFLCYFYAWAMLLLWVFLWPALCFYGLNYATACACLYDTSMLASMIYLWATIRGLTLLETTSLSNI